MSRASAAVRFPDGTVKFGIYNGTCDVMQPGLFDNPKDPWDAFYAKGKFEGQPGACWPAEVVGEPEDVVIYSDYGGGFYWPGRATRNRIIGPLDWDGWDGTDREGEPKWAREAFKKAAREG